MTETVECPYCGAVLNTEPLRDPLKKHAEYCDKWPSEED